MNDFVLIDPPVTPYSPREEILLWAEVCRQELLGNPESKEWQEAILYTDNLLAASK